MKPLTLLCFAAIACSRPEGAPQGSGAQGSQGSTAAKPEPAPRAAEPLLLAPREITLNEGKVTVHARVPAGFTTEGGTTFWSPAEAQSIIRPSVSFTFTCDGVCSKENRDRALAGLAQGVKASLARPNFNTGDAKLDAMRLDVTVLEEGASPEGGRFVVLRATRGAGWDGPNLDQLTAVCAVPGPDFYVVTSVRLGLVDDGPLWPLLVAACKATTL